MARIARITRITRDVAQGWLADVPDDKRFWCADGRVFKNLFELEAGLHEMSDDTFGYHANECKNDFSNWIKNVVGDEKLARDLQRSKNREQAAKSIASRIAWLRSKR
jgi:hypothetical protein